MSLQVDFKLFMTVSPLGSFARVEGYIGHWAFTPLGVCASHDGGFQNIWMCDQFLLNGEAGRVLDLTIREDRPGGTHAHLAAGNDDVLTPVLDAHRSIGVHDGQVTSMEVTALEHFLGSLVICEILRTRSGRKCQNKRITKGWSLSIAYVPASSPDFRER